MVVLWTSLLTCIVAGCNWPTSLGKDLKANYRLYHHPILRLREEIVFLQEGQTEDI